MVIIRLHYFLAQNLNFLIVTKLDQHANDDNDNDYVYLKITYLHLKDKKKKCIYL